MVDASIEFGTLEQLFMGAAGADAAMIEDENEAGVAHRTEALGDDKRRAPLHQVAERQLNLMFRGGIDTGRGIVHYQECADL